MNRKSVYKLINFISGVASCATSCPCCKMHAEGARKVLGNFERRTQVSAKDAYEGVRTAEKLSEDHGTTGREISQASEPASASS